MKSMKFYIYSSNIAILIFSVIFIIYGFKNTMYILIGLGVALGLYGSIRLYRMLKALKNRGTDDDPVYEG